MLKPAATLILMLMSTSSYAVIIEITGQGVLDGKWDVTTFEDSSVSTPIRFRDEAEATIFADAVGDLLGTPNVFNSGPYFAYDSINNEFVTGNFAVTFTNGSTELAFVVVGTYATAERVLTEVSEPATFSLLGLGLIGLIFARRKRI